MIKTSAATFYRTRHSQRRSIIIIIIPANEQARARLLSRRNLLQTKLDRSLAMCWLPANNLVFFASAMNAIEIGMLVFDWSAILIFNLQT